MTHPPQLPPLTYKQRMELLKRRRDMLMGQGPPPPKKKKGNAAKIIGLVLGSIVAFFVFKESDVVQGGGDSPPAVSGNWGTQPLPKEEYAGFSYVQQKNASIIVRVAEEMKMPQGADLVAVVTAMQECSLHNCANKGIPESYRYNPEGEGEDHDSVGVFQQRPSQGWGTVQNLMNPAYAAGKFYDKLNKISGWQSMRVGDAAQAVQNSKFPERYAKHEIRAKSIIARVRLYKPM